MRRLFGLVLLTALLAACAAPTAPAAPAATSPAQVPVTGPTTAPTVAMPPTPTTGMKMSPTAAMTMAPTQAMQMTAEPTQAIMPSQPAMGPTTPAASGSGSGVGYTVLVGAEDVSQGAEIEAFFPSTLHVHVGDKVTFKQNANEIHTVTFLAGQQSPQFILPMPGAPQGAVMFNPMAAFPAGSQNGQYDGSAVAGSGIMGMGQGQVPSFNLTFTKPGTYAYECVIHSAMKMSGTVVVDDPSASIPTPDQVTAQAQQDVTAALAKVPAVVTAAQNQMKPAVKNADGSMTHYVTVGYEDGQVDLMSFFPKNVVVKSGDTVTWEFSPKDMAPHTITFLNGADEPPLVKVIPQSSGAPILTFDPGVALPQNAGQALTNQGIYSSGVIDPAAPGPHTFSIKIGALQEVTEFECLLHDTDGMKGTLTVAP